MGSENKVRFVFTCGEFERMKLSELSDDELREISLMRTKKGSYTKDALRAQRILNYRTGFSWGKNNNAHSDNWDGSFDNAVRAYEDY